MHSDHPESINLQINSQFPTQLEEEESEEEDYPHTYSNDLREVISPTGKKSPGKGYQKVRSKVAGNLKSQ